MAERLKGAEGPLRVAVVEDDPDHALLASEALEESGHRVVHFATGGEALAAYRPGAWDVVTLDYRLPDMNGLQVLKRIQAMPAAPPVVMVTAGGDEMVAVGALKQGARDYVVKTGEHGTDLVRAVELAVAEHRMQQTLVLHRLDVERRANTDALTGALNRHRLAEELAGVAGRSTETGEPYAVVLVDINKFKRVNDTYGHAAGDAMLAALADLLRRCIRKEDVLARYGGDEFVMIMPGLDRETCQQAVVRITSQLEFLRIADCPELRVSVAIGSADWSAGEPSEVLAEADRAMYEQKALVRA
jgi:diguanylate cyclase (GGDEF)-like protein